MTTLVGIGEFSRLTHLSVKTLHHYHDVGLLAPATVDPGSGYRRYALDQVTGAHLIGRLRALNMPLPEVRRLLAAPDPASRDALLQHHLERMEAELARTREAVASLRALLAPAALSVTQRTLPAQRVLARTAPVSRDELGPWAGQAFVDLVGQAAACGAEVAGPAGATYSRAFFAEDRGEVMAYVPVTEPVRGPATELRWLPGGTFAVTLHAGPYQDFDRTYGALGSHVVARGWADPDGPDADADPVREVYLVGPGDATDPYDFRTDVCWPVRTSPHQGEHR